MSVPWKQTLLVGATSGIGAALAERLIASGVKVVAAGRRTDRLDAFVARHGASKAAAVRVDLADRESLTAFSKSVTTNFPEIDSVVLNAGTQSPFNLIKPGATDELSRFHNEVAVNFSAFVDLSMRLQPLLRNKPASALVFVSSHLGFVPATPLPAYSASKAALSAYAITLREQLRGTGVRVIDLWPPPVQTELHDYMGPDKGRKFGMPVEEFVDEAMAGLIAGKEEIIVGTGPAPKEEFDACVGQRTKWAEALALKQKALFAEHL